MRSWWRLGRYGRRPPRSHRARRFRRRLPHPSRRRSRPSLSKRPRPRRRASPRSPRPRKQGSRRKKKSRWTTRSTTTTPLSRNRKKRTPTSPTSSAATSKTRRKGERRAGSDVRDRVRRRLHLPEHRGHFASRLLYPRKRTSAERVGNVRFVVCCFRLHEPAAALQALSRPACVEIVSLKALDLNRLIGEVDISGRAVMPSLFPLNSMVRRKIYFAEKRCK